MYMSREQKMERLGNCGEKIVANYLSSLGKTITFSVDGFDSEKDFLSDNEKVEVKTQVPFIFKSAFTIKPEQLKKCRNVSSLYFVTVAATSRSSEWDFKLYSVDPENFIYYTHITKDGRLMVLIPIKQPSVREVMDICEEDRKQLLKFRVSEY